MSKILKNNSGSNVDISDVGITINNGTQYTIPPTDYLLWAASNDAVTFIGNGSLVVNDGSVDLSISDGVDLIKGIFPTTVDANITSSVLPSGASTSANQGTLNTRVGDLTESAPETDTASSGLNGRLQRISQRISSLITTLIDGSQTTNIADGPIYDAADRLRVSNPSLVFDCQFTDGDKSFVFSDFTTTGGTVARNATSADIELSVTTTPGSRALRQTRKYLRYTPGESFLVLCTGNFGTPKTNLQQMVGYYDDNDGLFFRMNGTTLQVVKRSNVTGTTVETAVNQSGWNLDKLDGTGPSGITLVHTNQQIFVIDFLWLGSGRVRFGFKIDGKIRYVHEMLHANRLTTKYSRRSSLPIRYEIVNVGATASASKLTATCFSATSEGTPKNNIALRSYYMTSNRTVNALEPLIALRLNASNIRSGLDVKSIGIVSTSADSLAWSLVINPTLTGGAWTSPTNNTISQVNDTATSVSGGDRIASGVIAQNTSETIDISETLQGLGSSYSGTSDIVVLCCQSLNNNAGVFGSITWEELY